jgi:hypothetical protein
MAGRRQPKTRRPVQEGQDEHYVYQALCTELADLLGWETDRVTAIWSQIALAREWCGEPRWYAEHMAWANIQRCFEEQDPN